MGSNSDQYAVVIISFQKCFRKYNLQLEMLYINYLI